MAQIVSKGNLIKEYHSGGTVIRIFDSCYIGQTEKDIADIIAVYSGFATSDCDQETGEKKDIRYGAT